MFPGALLAGSSAGIGLAATTRPLRDGWEMHADVRRPFNAEE